MSRAPISVVIPTFNRHEIVCDAIDSVLSQTLLPSEIIVIDDGSADQTRQSLARYSNHIRYHFQPNSGLPAARNQGIRLSTEPLIAFLDDDDVWHPRKLELQMDCFQAHSEVALLGAEQFDWPAARFPALPAEGMLFQPVSWEQLVVRTLIPISSVVVRREVLDQAGVFDVTFRSSEDRDWFLRVAEVAPVGVVPAPLSGYRDTPGSMCKNPAGREQAMRRILNSLDQRDAWRGRRLLRRKAYSFMHFVCSDAHSRSGNHAQSILRLLKSVWHYPFSYQPEETRKRFERPKRIVVNALRMAGLRKPDRVASIRPPLQGNALQELRKAVGTRMQLQLAD